MKSSKVLKKSTIPPPETFVISRSARCYLVPNTLGNLAAPYAPIKDLFPTVDNYLHYGSSALPQFFHPWAHHINPHSNRQSSQYSATTSLIQFLSFYVLAHLNTSQHQQNINLLGSFVHNANNATLEVITPIVFPYLAAQSSALISIKIDNSKLLTRKLIFLYNWIAEWYSYVILKTRVRESLRWIRQDPRGFVGNLDSYFEDEQDFQLSHTVQHVDIINTNRMTDDELITTSTQGNNCISQITNSQQQKKCNTIPVVKTSDYFDLDFL